MAVAAVAGLAAPGPGRALADRHGIEAVLAVLVLATGLGIAPGALSEARDSARRIGVVIGVGLVALPALAWTVGRLVPAGSLREGVIALGVAPTEIAAVAITGMVGGNAAITATVLVVTSLSTVVLAGPVLSLLAGSTTQPPVVVLATLLLVVALPLAAGVAVRRGRHGSRLRRLADPAAVATVSVLVWLVASQVDQTSALARTVGAVLLFLAGTLLLGTALAHRTRPTVAHALRLSTGMRDFAVAAGAATAAFGPAAAGPAGIYGIAVLTLGAVYARVAPRAEP